MPAPEAELADALKALRHLVRDLREGCRTLPSDQESVFRRLREVTQGLAHSKQVRPVRCAAEYLAQWDQVMARQRSSLDRAAVRHLCWHPETATDPAFHSYLDRYRVPLGAQSLHGLLRSLHVRWTANTPHDPIMHRVKARIEAYTGSNALLTKWKAHLPLILGEKAPEAFAVKMVNGRLQTDAHCAAWSIDEESGFFRAAMLHAVGCAHRGMRDGGTLFPYLLQAILGWSHWSRKDFACEVSATIEHKMIVEDMSCREALIMFALRDRRLGDPRLPANSTKWLDITDEAQRRFLSWLSRADIEFFFQAAMPEGQDPHGRREFWLQYVHRVQMSRPLLDRDDIARLRRLLNESGAKAGHFGRLEGATSAFLLDFGPIVAVEFSRIGNACYIYEKREFAKLVKDFWSSTPFSIYVLKTPKLCATRMIHKVGWQDEMQRVLARHGIRRS